MKKKTAVALILASALIATGLFSNTTVFATTLNSQESSGEPVSESPVKGDKEEGEKLYANLLDVYYSGYQSYTEGSMSWEEEQAFYANSNVFEPYDLHGSSLDGSEYHRDLGYAFFDLNQDDAPELLIRSYPGDGKSPFYGFDAIYAIKDGTPVLLDNSWYRDHLYLLENGYMTHEFSGGSTVYDIDVMELSGDELVTLASENVAEEGSGMELNWDEGYLEGSFDTDGSHFKLYYFLPEFYSISEYPYSGAAAATAENEPQEKKDDGQSQQNSEADSPFSSAQGTIELTDYLQENIEEVKKQFPDMHDVGASDATEYANSYLILSAPYSDTPIEFINLMEGGSGISILGIEIGMNFEDAEDGIRKLIVSRENWSANIRYYELSGGSALRLDYDDTGRIIAIAIWADSEQKAGSIQDLYAGLCHDK